MSESAPGFIRWAARGTLLEELGPDADAVLAATARLYEAPCRGAGAGRRAAAYLSALREALVEQGCSADRASALVAESLARAMDRIRVPLEVAAWWRHPRNRLARARWRQSEEARLLFRSPAAR